MASQTTKDTNESPTKIAQLSSSGSEGDLEIQGADGKFAKGERKRLQLINKHTYPNRDLSINNDLIEEINSEHDTPKKFVPEDREGWGDQFNQPLIFT